VQVQPAHVPSAVTGVVMTRTVWRVLCQRIPPLPGWGAGSHHFAAPSIKTRIQYDNICTFHHLGGMID
jgi:hypothetical protein